MRLLVILILLFTAGPAFGQGISNVRATLEGNEVVILYDLGGPSGQTFKVELFSSHNSYSTPLRQVSGDIGDNISPGNNKRVVWRAKQELRVFSGDVQFEVRAESLFEPLRVTSPVAGGTYKGGKNLPITWRGGTAGEPLTIDIMRDGRVYRSLGSVTNTGSYYWAIPKKMEKSDGYSIRLTPEAGNTATSQGFTMKKKGSLVIPLVAVAVAGGVAAAVLLGGTDPGPDPIQDNDLPRPPDPPGN